MDMAVHTETSNHLNNFSTIYVPLSCLTCFYNQNNFALTCIKKMFISLFKIFSHLAPVL